MSFVELNEQREAEILARFAAEMQVDEVEAETRASAEAKLRDLGLL